MTHPHATGGAIRDDGVRGLVDRMAIHALVVKYAKARDTTDPDLYREIFAPEAVIALGNGKVMSKDLEEICEKSRNDQLRFNPGKQPGATSYGIMRHDVGNLDITVDGDVASSDYYVNTIAYNEAKKRPELISSARNEDEYVRRDGQWWIVRSTIMFGWENEAMGKALQIGPYTPPEYRR